MCEGSTFSDVFQKIPMKPIKKLDLGTMERDFSGQKSTTIIPAYVALKIALWSCQQQSYRQTRLPVLEIRCQPLVTLFTTCQAHNYMLPWRFCIGMALLGFCCSGYWSNTLHSRSDPGKSCTVVLEVNLSTCSPLWSSASPPPTWWSARSYNCLHGWALPQDFSRKWNGIPLQLG